MGSIISRWTNQQQLLPSLSADPLDTLEAVPDLVEQNITPQEIKSKVALRQENKRKRQAEAPAAVGNCSSTGGKAGLEGVLAQLGRADGTVRDTVPGLDRTLRKADGLPSKKVGM